MKPVTKKPDYLRDLPPLRAVVKAHDLAPSKRFSQNFLFDFHLLNKIAVRGGAGEDTRVVEVGAGPGGLTRALLDCGSKVLAIEKDERFRPALDEIKALAKDAFDYHLGDALTFVPPEAWRGAKLIANLPYQIATPLLVRWLTEGGDQPWFSRLTLMVQKEVADRIIAKPGDKAYGRLSVLVSWRADAKRLFDVPPEAFFPPPKVTSSLISLVPKAEPLPCDGKVFSEVLRLAFGQRRKMIRSSLKQWLPKGEASLAEAHIKPTARPEELNLEQFIALSRLKTAFKDAQGVQ